MCDVRRVENTKKRCCRLTSKISARTPIPNETYKTSFWLFESTATQS